MTVHTLKRPPSNDPVLQARVHLAAAHRLAVLDGFAEGIDNHFTLQVPGREGQYMTLPFGMHWSEARASDMIIFDEQGRTLEGQGEVELSALCIHAPMHRLTGAAVILHTHQPWATALNLLEDNRLLPVSQTAAFFHGTVAYDDQYNGTADFLQEGERLAGLLQGNTILFMKNHGVVVTGHTVAQAYRKLYKLERACQIQMLAMGTGKPMHRLSDEVIAQVKTPAPHDQHPRSERERLYFEAMMRVLDRQMPGYAD
jgi:ribulose-5-phosphate 4-epimerase/fuculose-1-phosphate aldolase